MAQARVMHYLNQFFAGMGGEEKADTPLGFYEEPVGPGKRLQALLRDSAKIVVTPYCGDNYFHEHHDEVLEKVLQIAKDKDVQMVVAGPAFGAGRYGSACVEVCHYLSSSANLHGVTGMYIENPGVDAYKQYKDRRVFILPTSDAITDMEDALSKMAKFALKLASGSIIGSAIEEGYIPRGFRFQEAVSKSGVERAIDMLLNKVAGRSFTTEVPLEKLEEIPVAPRITNLKDACIALASSSGVTSAGNPYGFTAYRNTQFKKYSIEKLNSMLDTKWDVMHGGYDTGEMYDNTNFGVPLDAARELEREGVFARLYPYFYGTTGVQALISAMEAIGRGIAADMKAESVNGVLLVST